jgi:hypothetical protein
MTDQFVINRLRSKPVTYKVEISHFVAGGKWQMGIQVNDISEMDRRNRESIAADLRRAADMMENEDYGWEPAQ